MPNWITTKVEAPKHVIESMINDEGKIDFNNMMPFQGSHDNFDGILLCAEQAAEISNLLRFKMRYIKKYIGVLYNLLVCVTGGSLLMMIIWLLLQIFVFPHLPYLLTPWSRF